jgi:hypothetical protein
MRYLHNRSYRQSFRPRFTSDLQFITAAILFRDRARLSIFPAPWRSSGAISSSSSGRCLKSFIVIIPNDERQVRPRFHLAKRSRKGRRPWRGAASGAKRRFGYFRAIESSPPKAAPAAGGTAFRLVELCNFHSPCRSTEPIGSDHPHPSLPPPWGGKSADLERVMYPWR